MRANRRAKGTTIFLTVFHRAAFFVPVWAVACVPAPRATPSGVYLDAPAETHTLDERRATDAASETSTTPLTDEARLKAAASTCHAPLSQHCLDFPVSPEDSRLCGTYGTALARMQRSARLMCPDHDATLAMGDAYLRTEKCGSFRVLAWAGLFGSERAYYDAQGALVAIETTSDVGRECEGHLLSFGTTYGEAPACAGTEIRSLCP